MIGIYFFWRKICNFVIRAVNLFVMKLFSYIIANVVVDEDLNLIDNRCIDYMKGTVGYSAQYKVGLVMNSYKYQTPNFKI